uniref:Uncharacterized protein n=1 Tax=Biomphalaria glabrata TaxID=6526 RepID=A0A2C9KT16_BIOGL
MTKKCINNDDRCNGDDDCGDDSDEQNCTVCQAGSWQCDNRKCIKSRHKCDGDDDCGDESDERYCETCKSTSWLCNTGLRCINHNKKCDGYKDCPDNSDENCTVCNAGVDRCEDGTCLSRNLRCNGVKDCLDNSDEVPDTNTQQYELILWSMQNRSMRKLIITKKQFQKNLSMRQEYRTKVIYTGEEPTFVIHRRLSKLHASNLDARRMDLQNNFSLIVTFSYT